MKPRRTSPMVLLFPRLAETHGSSRARHEAWTRGWRGMSRHYHTKLKYRKSSVTPGPGPDTGPDNPSFARTTGLCYLHTMNPALEKSEAAILDRVFRPNAADWPRAAAEAILNIGFDSSDLKRMAQLMERAKTGDLSQEQAEELEHYRHIGRLLELMKSRARQSLQNTPTG